MRSLALLPVLAVLALAACSGDDGAAPPQLRPEDYTVRKVSGDGQRGQVKLSGSSAAALPVGLSLQVAPSSDLLPQPLVVKVQPKPNVLTARYAMPDPLAPSFSVAESPLPTVSFRVRDEGACGRSFIAAAVPDADSTAATFWERGTRAGAPCWMYVHTVVRDAAGQPVPMVQDSFSATFEAGPAAYTLFSEGYGILSYPLSRAFPALLVMDRYENAVPYRVEVEAPFRVVGDTLGTVAARTLEVIPGSPPPVVQDTARLRVRIAGDSVIGRGRLIWGGGSVVDVRWDSSAFPFRRPAGTGW